VDREEILRKVNSIEWYHVIEVAPGIETPGRCDRRPQLDQVGFPKDLTGKTVLDIGAYDGFYSFEAEKRGATRVLGLDRHPADFKGFALGRELLNSKAEYAVGSVYDLSPEVHGVFDVVLFLGVLYHLRHPLLALDKIHRVCRELLLIESHILDGAFIHEGELQPLARMHPWLEDAAVMQFYAANELNGDYSNWWAPSVECLRQMLETSGFRPELVGHWGSRAAFRAERLEFSPNPAWY
jgi:tRNA (mo5U34)-methyltransferase